MRFSNHIKSVSITKQLNEASDTERTALQEGLHSVALAIIQTTGKVNRELLADKKVFNTAYNKYCDLDRLADILYEFGINSPDWSDSVISSVTKLKSSPYLKKGNYKIHRGSKFMDTLYATAKRLLKEAGWGNIPNDKWNPGDIWLSIDNKILTKAPDIDVYNAWIHDSLLDSSLIGVSLKKVGGSPKVEYVDKDNKRPFYRFKGVHIPNTPFVGGITLNTNKNMNVDVRSFNMPAGSKIRAEVKIPGSKAAHGKATIALMEKTYSDFKLTPMSGISDNDTENIIKMKKLWGYNGAGWTEKQMIEEYNARLNDKGQITYWSRNKKAFVPIKSNKNYFRTIINSLEVGKWFMTHRKEAHNAIGMLSRYGMSMSDFSSNFLKVY